MEKRQVCGWSTDCKDPWYQTDQGVCMHVCMCVYNGTGWVKVYVDVCEPWFMGMMIGGRLDMAGCFITDHHIVTIALACMAPSVCLPAIAKCLSASSQVSVCQ